MKGNDEIVREKEKPIDKYILIYTHICMKQKIEDIRTTYNQINKRIPEERKCGRWLAERQTDRLADDLSLNIWIDRQINTEIHRQINRDIDKQTDGEANSELYKWQSGTERKEGKRQRNTSTFR